MLKASGAMAAATLLSRVLGLVREQAYMFFLGTTWVNDAFQYAFTIPNLFRRLLGEGALTAAFIPVFKEKEKLHGEQEMWRAANAVISGLIISASVIIGLVMLGISIALAAHEFAPKTELMLQLLRVMFPYMLLVCLAAVNLSPCSKSNRMIGSAKTTSKTAAIRFAKSSVASPCRSVARNSGKFLSTASALNVVSRYVASEIPNMPCGNSISRTA